jgi:hypothetical protein
MRKHGTHLLFSNEHHRNIHVSPFACDAPAYAGCVRGNRASNRYPWSNIHTYKKPMTTSFAVSYFILSFASCFACYRLGQQNILHRFKQYCDKRKRDDTTCSKFEDFINQ